MGNDMDYIVNRQKSGRSPCTGSILCQASATFNIEVFIKCNILKLTEFYLLIYNCCKLFIDMIKLFKRLNNMIRNDADNGVVNEEK